MRAAPGPGRHLGPPGPAPVYLHTDHRMSTPPWESDELLDLIESTLGGIDGHDAAAEGHLEGNDMLVHGKTVRDVRQNMDSKPKVSRKPVSQDEFRRIRLLEAAGRSYYEIAKLLGRTRGTICKYAANYVPGETSNQDTGYCPTEDEIRDECQKIREAKGILDDKGC
jgi:hypothetical protein